MDYWAHPLNSTRLMPLRSAALSLATAGQAAPGRHTDHQPSFAPCEALLRVIEDVPAKTLAGAAVKLRYIIGKDEDWVDQLRDVLAVIEAHTGAGTGELARR